jgi:hypothetical protein
VDAVTLSNALSWVLVCVILLKVHEVRTDGLEWGKCRAIGWAVFGLALLVNTASRIIDESFLWVMYGSIVGKAIFIPTLLLEIFERNRQDG